MKHTLIEKVELLIGELKTEKIKFVSNFDVFNA